MIRLLQRRSIQQEETLSLEVKREWMTIRSRSDGKLRSVFLDQGLVLHIYFRKSSRNHRTVEEVFIIFDRSLTLFHSSNKPESNASCRYLIEAKPGIDHII